MECSTGKVRQLNSNALAELMGRLKLAASPASRCFLVALFISGFTNRYFGDLRSKTDPQYAANADVENHPPKSRAKLPPVSLLSARNVSKVFLYQVGESSAFHESITFLRK